LHVFIKVGRGKKGTFQTLIQIYPKFYVEFQGLGTDYETIDGTNKVKTKAAASKRDKGCHLRRINRKKGISKLILCIKIV